MRKLVVGAILVTAFAAAGCQDGKMPWSKKEKATTQAARDDCAMCPGVQTASADGTCPKCGMTPPKG